MFMRDLNKINEALRRASDLKGKEEFKTLMKYYAKIFIHMYGKVEPECEMFVFRRALLLSIDKENGCEELVEIYAKLWEGFLNRLDLTINYHTLKMPEMMATKPGTTLRDAVLEDFENQIESSLRTPVLKICCIDISEWIDKITEDAFRAILSRLRQYMHNNLMVFRIPAVDENTLKNIKEAIGWYINVDEVYSQPDSQENYLDYGLKCLEEKDIELDEGAQVIFRELIDQARKRPDFWGFKTIDRLVNDIVIRALWPNGIMG